MAELIPQSSKSRVELITEITSRLDEFSDLRLSELVDELNRGARERAIYAEIEATIPEEWRADFREFITTGEAREEFLSQLDSDPESALARAIARVIESQARDLAGLKDALGEVFG